MPMKPSPLALFCLAFLSLSAVVVSAQTSSATRSGFSWITSENVSDMNMGAGYTAYAAAWPIF
ncbi:MAG: hypothetical protein L7S67_07780, partial [Flavobacteriales bacterium]|nr:hypothetical protein [Flavobacteriales bacterium]